MSDQFPVFMATDSLAIDSRAPWMQVAYDELKKGTREFKTDDTFAKLFYVSFNITGYRMNPVGYRWPTRFNHLLTQPSNTATA